MSVCPLCSGVILWELDVDVGCVYSMFVTGTGACLMDNVQYYSVDEPQHYRLDLPLPSAGLKPSSANNHRHQALSCNCRNPSCWASRYHPESSAVTFDITNVVGTSGLFQGRHPVVRLKGTTPTTPSPHRGEWSTLPILSLSKDAGLWNL